MDFLRHKSDYINVNEYIRQKTQDFQNFYSILVHQNWKVLIKKATKKVLGRRRHL